MPSANPNDKIVDRLKRAIKNADYDATGAIAQEALDAGIQPDVIMQQGVCDALMELEHDLFGEQKAWMHPRHLMGAESARRAIAVLEPSVKGGAGSQGTVVIGVPSGDTHDFGTKTVALTLMAGGFKVEYLGRDVPPSRFVQKAQEVGADIVGVSCYQTTNFKRIEEILDLISHAKLNDKVKVMVGGSVITQKYADKKKSRLCTQCRRSSEIGPNTGREVKPMDKMTAGKRIMKAAVGQEPDRVPVFGIFNDWAWAQLFGRDSLMDYSLDAEKLAKVMVWTCKEMGCDSAVVLPVHPMAEAICEASGLPVPSVRWKDFIPTDAHTLYEGDLVNDPAYGNPIIETLKDAEKLVPADPYKHGRLPVLIKAIELANKELNGEWPIGGMVENPISVGGGLMGWTQVFMAMEKDMELWKKVEAVAIESSYRFGIAQIKAGSVFGVSHTELPPRVGSKEFLAHPEWVQADHPPELYKRLWDEEQFGCSMHACTVGPFVDGIDAWKTMLDHTPSFFMAESGGADALAHAKKELAPAMVMGNIHPVDIMLHGTPSDVEAASMELIQKCGPGGRFQLGPGCTYSLDTPYENLKAMVDSAQKYGQYPIRI